MRAMAAPSLLLKILCSLACSCSLSFAQSSSPQKIADLHDSCPDLLTLSSPSSSPRDNGTLLLAVPWKIGFDKFVSFSPDDCNIAGFSIDIFRSALPHLQDPRLQSCRLVLVGDGTQSPSYDDMIEMLRNKRVDGLVGDFTITRNRLEEVGFTVPYLASYLVLVAPSRYADQGRVWGFLMPFSKELWGTLVVCFMVTGLSLYFLEDKNPDFIITSKNKEGDSSQHAHAQGPSTRPSDESTNAPLRVRSVQDNYNHLLVQDVSSLQRPGPPIYDRASHRRRFQNAYWFTSLCVFQSQQESVQTHLGRIVTGMWLFAMLIFTAGYTASLTSIVSSQKRYPTIEGFQALLRDRSITVGCQEGSFMENYMRTLNLMEHKIKKFNSTKQYVEALHKGNGSENGVGAVLEEAPYIGELVQSHPCDLMKSSRGDDHLPVFGGLGFAFRHGDALIDQLSKTILQMASNGTLKKLQKKWQIEHMKDTKCRLDATLSHLGLKSFAGLFSVVSAVYLICVGWHLLKTKPIKTPNEQSCAPIHALSCSQDESAIDRQAGDLSLIRGENRACDTILENQSHL